MMTGWLDLNYKATKIIKRFVVTLLHLFMITAGVLAQDATATAVPDDAGLVQTQVTARFSTSDPRPLTGKAFTLELDVSLPPGIELAEMPAFPVQGAWGDFDVIHVDEIQTELQPDGSTIYRQVLTVKLWQPRDYYTPETFVGYRLSGFNDVQRIPVRGVSISVPTVLDFDDLTLRPFKPLINLPYISPLLIAGIVIAICGAVGVGYWRWKQRPAPVLPPEPVLTPGEIALKALHRLKSSEEISPEAQYTQTVEALRNYVQAKFATGALTTTEMMTVLQTRLPEKMAGDLGRILNETDEVKFAGAPPQIEVAPRLTEAARRWIEGVERIMPEGQTNNADNSQ